MTFTDLLYSSEKGVDEGGGPPVKPDAANAALDVPPPKCAVLGVAMLAGFTVQLVPS
jgi:hypothetical protein